MADNVSITAGTGTTIAADEPAAGAAAGAKVQRVKPMVGKDGEATDVSNESPMPVSDAGGSLTVDSEALGTKAEAEASGEGGVIGILKRLRTLWGAGLPGSLTAGGNLKVAVVEALPAGTQEVGKVRATLEAGSAAIGKLAANAGVNIGSVGLVAASHEGVEPKLVISAASTNSTLVKGSAGKVFGWHIFNKEAVPIYVKLYNLAAAPTVGTSTQAMVIPIPAGAAANVEFTNGIAFGTGIGLGITKGAANANTEAVAAEGVIVNLLFK